MSLAYAHEPEAEPRRAQVIVVGNQKGGAGKSTVAMHVIVALMRMGWDSNRPWDLRSSVTRPTPAAMACSGEAKPRCQVRGAVGAGADFLLCFV